MRLARYSFVAVDPRAHLEVREGRIELTRDGETEVREGSAQEALRRALSDEAVPQAPPGLPPLGGPIEPSSCPIAGAACCWLAGADPAAPNTQEKILG